MGKLTQYKNSLMLDINGKLILEGSIINADGYNSDLKTNYFHCVEFYDGVFGSDIYGDFEPLSRYQTIEVIGHCSDYADRINDPNFKWSGNLGVCIQEEKEVEIRMGNSCGSCIHTKRPKTPRDHAAHYEVANTERWCFKHNCHVTRETTCDDHEGMNRGAKTAFTKLQKYNARQKAILEVVALIGDKPVFTRDYIFFVKNNWLYRVYGTNPAKLEENNYNTHYSVRSKDSGTDRYLKEIREIIEKIKS